MTRSFIVTANFLKRGTGKPWLIREAASGLETAKEYTTIRATQVVFQPSTDIEEGWGCNMVAACQAAEGLAEDIDVGTRIRIYYDIMSWSFHTASGQPVKSCAELLLCANGSMYAIEPTSIKV